MTKKEIFFDCPICNQKFSLEQLINHNEEAFNDFINSQAEELFLKRKSALEGDLKAKFTLEKEFLAQQINNENLKQIREIENNYLQKEHELKVQLETSKISLKKMEENLKLTLEKEYSQKINELNKIIQDLKSDNGIKSVELKELKTNQDNLLNSNKLALEKQYSNEINNLKMEIFDLNSNKKLQETETLAKIEKQKNELLSNFGREKENLTEKYIKQIEELKVKNAENRILQSKTKGENWEIEVENELHKAFDLVDKVEKITKSTEHKKADYLQIVRNFDKVEIGKIVYEVKNAKWSDSWLSKLAVDIANNNAKYGILVTTSFNEKYQIDTGFKQSDDYENIWITDPYSFIFVAQIIRKLIEVEYNYNYKESKLLGVDNDKIFAEYQKKVNDLKVYMSKTLPVFSKSFKKQLEDITSVKVSLVKNSEKLNKSVEMLEKKFNRLIKKELEQITGELVLDSIEDSKLNFDEIDPEINLEI